MINIVLYLIIRVMHFSSGGWNEETGFYQIFLVTREKLQPGNAY